MLLILITISGNLRAGSPILISKFLSLHFSAYRLFWTRLNYVRWQTVSWWIHIKAERGKRERSREQDEVSYRFITSLATLAATHMLQTMPIACECMISFIFYGWCVWCAWALNDFSSQLNSSQFQNQINFSIQLLRLLMFAARRFNKYHGLFSAVYSCAVKLNECVIKTVRCRIFRRCRCCCSWCCCHCCRRRSYGLKWIRWLDLPSLGSWLFYFFHRRCSLLIFMIFLIRFFFLSSNS